MTNLIFSRRALQKRLESLEAIFAADVHKHLIARIESPGRNRLAAVWEAVMLPALHSVSPLRHESPLADGSRPDFAITYVYGGTAFEIVGDITSVSDRGLHDNNPVGHFWQEIVRLARKHRLDPNHFHYDIKSRSDGEFGDARTVLLLPPRKELSALSKQKIEPFVRGLARDSVTQASLPYSAPGIAFTLTYDQTQRFGGGGHAVYSIPYSRTKIPYTPRSTRKRISYVMRLRTRSALSLLAMPIVTLCRAPMHRDTAVTRPPRLLPISCAPRRPLISFYW